MAKEKIVAPEENQGTKKLLGTFTAPPPLCLGEPYVTKSPKDARSTGKQLQGGPLRHENSKVNPGTFEPPKLLWSESHDKFADGIRYKDLYADKKKFGFLSSDFPRRDEFSNTTRTEQLREVLKKETRMLKEVTSKAMARDTARQTAEHILSSTPEWKKPPLYDVVYRIPEASLKLARDDRQAGLWYREERKNAEKGTEHPKDHRPDGPTWVSISLNGKALNVLVDGSGRVLGRKDADPVVRSNNSGLDE
uniref:Uncharacterized protein n=1 Tax=Cryptomonas curvata TaxID=233186 RepID=A0A7S0MCX8_9CRYP|mmetsp:Transcript_35242/g.73811  ORF Transcript_35242/g.73811 Transcript_35242/m.73811 type:complete len:250 (+) Transcript_35242:124-873(+)